jgi:DNA-binding NtrC family response regulator
LYFRLNVVPLELPPLAQRTEDIESLINHFLALFEDAHSLTAPKFSKPALKALKAYPWPGNIRELRNVCERLSILLAGRVIEPENLPSEFTTNIISAAPAATNFTLPEAGLQLDTLEADLIQQALNRTKGNRSKSARLLGISRDTLLYRMQKYGFAM